MTERRAGEGARGVREELLAAVRSRLERVDDTGDLSSVKEPRALAEAQRLAELLRAEPHGDDLMAWKMLGRLHWFRHSALPEGDDRVDLVAAVEAFTPCFLTGDDGLPEPLLPLLAGNAAPRAAALFQYALSSTDPDVLTAVVDIWGRIASAIPAGHPVHPMYLFNLATALQVRFERAGNETDLAQAIAVGREALKALSADDPDRARYLSALGNALRVRFERREDVADLDEAVGLLQAAVEASSTDHPDRATLTSNLGIALRARFDRTQDGTDLAGAVGHLRAATKAAPADHPERPLYLSNLGAVLRVKSERDRDRTGLDEAIGVGREALRALPAGHPDKARYLSNLGTALLSRFEVARDRADLDEAVDHLQAAAETAPANHPGRAVYMSNLRDALQTRSEWASNETSPDEAVTTGREALRTLPADHPSQARYLSGLGVALQHRFGRAGDRADLDEAIDHLHAAVEATPADHPDRTTYLSNLGVALQDRFERAGDRADLDEAIDHLHAAVEAASTDHVDRAGCLTNLGAALRTRFEWAGDETDLDEAIAAGRKALRDLPPHHPDGLVSRNNLGHALQARFGRTGGRADLDEAIDHLRIVVEATPADHPDRADCLSNLGGALRDRFERAGDETDLDEAITHGRKAVEATPAQHPGRNTRLSNLGNALLSRFERAGGDSGLDEAIDRFQAAVEATPADHPDRARYLSNLGGALRDRFERAGDETDLDEAIAAGRNAVQATPVDHPNQAVYLSNLAVALQHRFGRAGGRADLDEAIDRLRAAVGATAADHPERAKYLSNLGVALRDRFERAGDETDLDEAIAAGRNAVQATPVDHPARIRHLSNLGVALGDRFARTKDETDLVEAIDRLRAAVKATPPDHSDRGRYLSNLGRALLWRFEQAGDRADLDEAIDHLRTAVDATPADHPMQAACLTNLGATLGARFACTRSEADLEDAVSAYTRVCESVTASPSVHINAARAVAWLVADSDKGRAADAAEAAVLLLPEVAPRRLGRSDQQHALGRFAGLVGDAAALALADPREGRLPRATRALRLLEAGRAVLYSQALDTRDDIASLHDQRPDLASRFVRLRDQLDEPLDVSPIGTITHTDTLAAPQETTVHDRHRLARDFAQTLTEIRSLKGFASFALPPTTEELLTEAVKGPVVVFNISAHRSDALLLTHDGTTHLELPLLTAETLAKQINAFHQALGAAAAGESKEQRRQSQDVLTGVLQWLWDAAAGPVLDVLGHHRQPATESDWPRVWWVPGGLLGLLPLHAAGYHTDPAGDSCRRTVMDRVISSYTPTVRALRHARRTLGSQSPSSNARGRGLLVTMPTTPGLPGHGRLRYVDAEAEVVRRHLPRTLLLREPDRADRDGSAPDTPTKAAVLNHLPDCSIAHFACHGASHPADPSRSLLLLHDYAADPFTVASLAPVRLDHAQLAYLSACRTAAIDSVELLDESIHLTSAFQLAGFPHVVGTLWEIRDQTAVAVADAFYTHLRTPTGALDTGRAAWALHQAVRGLRDGHDLPGTLDRTKVPFLWAAYLHAGA